MRKGTTRRDFLKQSAMLGVSVGFWVGTESDLLAQAQPKSALDKLNFACIGVGGKGTSDTEQAARFGNIVAICDIDDRPLEKMAARFPEARKYHDFRKMLDELANKIDAVVISTPDHTHAVAAVMAMRLGKHVYCQKPLTHNVYEARLLRETARKNKVCTQMGNQGTASATLRRGVEIIRAGVIGPVREVHVWTNRPIWPQAPQVMARPEPEPVPAHVQWDLFLGPAPERPYSSAYHPFRWRGWWDFGTGALGDMGCHTANLPFMALKLKYPISVEAQAGDVNPETYPSWAHVVWEFPAREGMPPVIFHWYEGKREGKVLRPPQELLQRVLASGVKDISSSGCIMVGDKGLLYSPSDYGGDWRLIPQELQAEANKVPQSLPRNQDGGDTGMKAELVMAIRENKPEIAMSNFDYAGPLTEFILLGNVAIKAGTKLQWDGENFKVTNNSEANKYLRREYRKGWEI
jgi:predicted dehydrogenase